MLAATASGQSLAVELEAADKAAQQATTNAPDELPVNPAPEYPEDKAARAFGNPPGARRLTMASRLWVDTKQQRVYVDGYIAMNRGPLEMFACPVGSKEHESVVAVLAKSREVHAALLSIGTTPGTPVKYQPRFVPPTGQQVRIWVCYRDDENKFQAIDGRKWIRRDGTQEDMKEEWVFSGSSFWKDPIDGKEYYQADGGDMVCVSNFSTAMMDVPFNSSAQADQLVFTPFTERIGKRDTPVRLIFVPIPVPTDNPNAKPGIDPNIKPTAKVLPPFIAEKPKPAKQSQPGPEPDADQDPKPAAPDPAK